MGKLLALRGCHAPPFPAKVHGQLGGSDAYAAIVRRWRNIDSPDSRKPRFYFSGSLAIQKDTTAQAQVASIPVKVWRQKPPYADFCFFLQGERQGIFTLFEINLG